MSNILDQIAAAGRFSEFRPKNLREFFALRLADKLGDAGAVRHYLDLAEEHTEPGLLAAYRRMISRLNGYDDQARRFHVELKRGNGHANGSGGYPGKLAALKIERRSVALAVFQGDHLDYTQIRQLSSSHEKAEASAAEFINWMCGTFEIESAALEWMSPESDIQRATLTRSIIVELRNSAVSIWEISKPLMLSAYGFPPARSRREMREVAHSIWPILGENTGALDAAALGLYVQTERLFRY